MPFPARGDRLSESFCQSVSLRAVADERQERSPLFFDRNQLFEDVVAVERLDTGAERVARRDGLGAQAAQVGRLVRFALAPGDGHLGRGTAACEALDERGVGHRRARPTRRSTRASSARARGGRSTLADLLDRVAQRALAAPTLFERGETRGFGGFDVLNQRPRPARDGLLLACAIRSSGAGEIRRGRRPRDRTPRRDVGEVGVQRDLDELGESVSRARARRP